MLLLVQLSSYILDLSHSMLFLPSAVHINCICWSKRSKEATIMSARNISWNCLLILHPIRAVAVRANTALLLPRDRGDSLRLYCCCHVTEVMGVLLR